MKNETVFRDKSIERISSPDQLNDYIRLSNPGVWFILSAIIVILVGACIFGIFGHIDSTVPAVGIVQDKHMTALVKKEYIDRFSNEMKVEVDGKRYEAKLKNEQPVTVKRTLNSYARFLGDMQVGEWIYEVDVDGTFEDGSYEAKLITEEISPLSFLFNKR